MKLNNKKPELNIEEKAARLEAALNKLSEELKINDLYEKINFDDFLFLASRQPKLVFRDIFMFFHDMIHHYVPEGKDDFEINEHSVGYVDYDCRKLFVEDCDEPFFADRLFANRFMNLIKTFNAGIKNNKIILFEGPPGSGKSTFLNNLLLKLEQFSNTPEGVMYKTYWRIKPESIKRKSSLNALQQNENQSNNRNFIEISCPSNDHPILQIPKKYRRALLEELIEDENVKEQIFNHREYNWIFTDSPCHICSSIFQTLLGEYSDPLKVLDTIYAKRITFNRLFGKGISVFNPGDEIFNRAITDLTLQNQINELFSNEEIKYIFSNLAYTNNGVYALMDIKENNIKRLTNLHGIISDGIHKVEHVEEKIKSIFLGLVNPEDKQNYENIKSFQDRITHVKIPYILDYTAEVNVYKHKFDNIEKMFLPGVLENFAKIIISTRMNLENSVVSKWLSKNVNKYSQYNDKNFLLLKMDLYRGIVPKWLLEEDIKNFTRDVRKALLKSAENEGFTGISGRNSINIFGTLISRFENIGKYITMDDVRTFFESNDKLNEQIPNGFIASLVNLYDYEVLQNIKESIYYFSEKQIRKEILNYLFALNYDIGNTVRNTFTNEDIEITEELYKNFEATILGVDSTQAQRESFRKEMHREFVTQTLAGEIRLKGLDIQKTTQYFNLLEKYTRSLKENALSIYIHNDNFRRCIMEFETQSFKNYPEKMKNDVKRLLKNLVSCFGYTLEGAKQVSIYAIDKKLWEKFGK
ncbi:MAG: hypothetical protein WHW07_05810 [Bacteroidales bacterium]|jgi:predicted Ser/Thr protein kinase